MTREYIFNQVFTGPEDFFITLVKEVCDELGLKSKGSWYIDWQSDLGDRVFILDSDDNEFTLRLWNVRDDENHIWVDYTMFYHLPDGEVQEL
jgi:hypothetical protein